MARGGEHLPQQVVVKMDLTVVLNLIIEHLGHVLDQQCGHGWVPVRLPGRKTVYLERSTVMWDVANGEVYGCGAKGHTGTLPARFRCERRTTLKSSVEKQRQCSWYKDGLPRAPFMVKPSMTSPLGSGGKQTEQLLALLQEDVGRCSALVSSLCGTSLESVT